MIDFHLLAYVGVLLVFLAGVMVVAVAVLVFACTVFVAIIAFGTVRRVAQPRPRRNIMELPLSMEEALRQVATGKVTAIQHRPDRVTAGAITATDSSSKKLLLAAGNSVRK